MTLERDGFGAGHDALGAAMCESWDLDASAVASVRHHVQARSSGEWSSLASRSTICALSVLAHALMCAPHSVDDVAHAVAPRADLDTVLVLRGVRNVQEQLAEAAATRPAAQVA
jgi:hypothetical protein